MALVPNPFVGGFSPLHFELAETLYSLPMTYLDITFPHRVVIRAILIQTPVAEKLKSFTLQSSETDLATPNQLTDLYSGQVTAAVKKKLNRILMVD